MSRGLPLLLALLAQATVHASRCEETSCDAYCDPLQEAHCSFCSCRTCRHCLHTASSKGPRMEPSEGKGGGREGKQEPAVPPTFEEWSDNADGRALPPAHQRTSEECEKTCSALKGVHCTSTKCQGCPFCMALRERSAAGQDSPADNAAEETPIALSDCGWLEQLTDARQSFGAFCSHFNNGGKGTCEVHYISTNAAGMYKRCLWTDTCTAGHTFSCGAVKPAGASAAASAKPAADGGGADAGRSHDKGKPAAGSATSEGLQPPQPVLGVQVSGEESASAGGVALRLTLTPNKGPAAAQYIASVGPAAAGGAEGLKRQTTVVHIDGRGAWPSVAFDHLACVDLDIWVLLCNEAGCSEKRHVTRRPPSCDEPTPATDVSVAGAAGAAAAAGGMEAPKAAAGAAATGDCTPHNADDGTARECSAWCVVQAAAKHCQYCSCSACGFCTPPPPPPPPLPPSPDCATLLAGRDPPGSPSRGGDPEKRWCVVSQRMRGALALLRGRPAAPLPPPRGSSAQPPHHRKTKG